MYWINMYAGSCSLSGNDKTNLPIQVGAKERRSQVKEVGRPAAIFSARRSEMRK